MQLKQILILAPILSIASAGVIVEGFLDGTTCNEGVGSTLLTANGECVEFNVPYVAMQVAGGGGDSCLLEVFFGDGCTVRAHTNVGPINDPNLGGCIGPFPDASVGPGTFPIKSGRLINCPQ